jgi:hypothetical protein
LTSIALRSRSIALHSGRQFAEAGLDTVELLMNSREIGVQGGAWWQRFGNDEVCSVPLNLTCSPVRPQVLPGENLPIPPVNVPRGFGRD